MCDDLNTLLKWMSEHPILAMISILAIVGIISFAQGFFGTMGRDFWR